MQTSRPPTISVLLPVRDGERHLTEAIESIRRQTLEDWELVAIDDGSVDGTARILREAAADGRVRVLRTERAGIAAALNCGLAVCRAPWIARMDADDVSLPTRFERQLPILQGDSSLAAVGCQVELFPRDELTEGARAYEEWLNSLTIPERVARECLVESPLVHPAALIRASALHRAGGWRSEGWPEDWALWLRLLRLGYRLTNVAEVLFHWRDHPARLTRTHPDYTPEAHLRLKAAHLVEGPLASKQCVVWGAGKSGRAFRKALTDLGVQIRLFVDVDPRKVGRTLHGVEVVPPEGLGPYSGTHLVAAVGAKGARALIRQHLERSGWRELDHFTCIG